VARGDEHRVPRVRKQEAAKPRMKSAAKLPAFLTRNSITPKVAQPLLGHRVSGGYKGKHFILTSTQQKHLQSCRTAAQLEAWVCIINSENITLSV